MAHVSDWWRVCIRVEGSQYNVHSITHICWGLSGVGRVYASKNPYKSPYNVICASLSASKIRRLLLSKLLRLRVPAPRRQCMEVAQQVVEGLCPADGCRFGLCPSMPHVL